MRKTITTLLAVALIGCDEVTTGIDLSVLELPVPEQTFGTPAVTSRRLAPLDTAQLVVPAKARAGAAFELVIPVASGGCLGSDTTVTKVSAQRLGMWVTVH